MTARERFRADRDLDGALPRIQQVSHHVRDILAVDAADSATKQLRVGLADRVSPGESEKGEW